MSEVDVPGGAFGPVRPRPADWKQNWPWAWRSGPAASAARRLTHPRLVAPLSLAQQRLWMLEQLHPGSALGNLPVAVRLRGALDRWALEQALAAVLERHQSLRTRFQSRDGEPWQEVWGAPVLALPLVDLSEPERQLPERLADQIGRPFNLSAEVLLRAALFRLAPQEHVLLVNLHHLVADACSCELLLEEVCRRYGAIVTGVPAPLPELPLQYTDYVAWEREELKRPPMQAHLAWWQQQLAGVPDLLELPTDRPRPVVASFRGERRELTLGEELTTGLRQLSRREGVSLGVLLQTAFHLLLHRLTGQADLVVGMPSSGRHRVEAERLIGLFVNPLALRSRLAGNPTFPELLHETQRTQLAALAHQALPFDRLVQELRLERSASHAPLLQTMFTFQGVPQRPLSWPGLTATRLNVHPGTAKHELTLAVSETPQNLIAELEYSAELFEGATMKRWLAHYQRLLAGIAATPEQRVRDLPLLGEAERHRLLVEWNQTRTPYPRRQCVHELFEAQAQARAEAVAVEFGQQQLTYGELDARASQLAQHLHQAGVGPGAPVAVAVERSLELIITLLAILKAGGAYAALDLASPRGRWQQILEDLRPPVLLTHSALLDRLPETCANLTGQAAPLVICIDAEAEAIRRQSMASPEVQVSAESLAYVSYTSGSTGRPKGVCVPHRAVVRLVKGTDYARFAPDEVFLHLSPVAFDASTFEIWGCLLNGARLVVAPPELPSLSDLADTLRQHQVTTAWFTTGLFNQMVDLQLEGL